VAQNLNQPHRCNMAEREERGVRVRAVDDDLKRRCFALAQEAGDAVFTRIDAARGAGRRSA
jgi:hypothetical protein